MACPTFNENSGGSACNRRGCCDEVTYGDWSGYGKCTKDCGGGKKSRSRTKTSKYDNSDCGTEVQTEDCNTQDCCSESNPTGCPKYNACRSGNTFVYSSTDLSSKALGKTTFQGTITHSHEVYLLGDSSNSKLYYIYVPEGNKFGMYSCPKEDYAYIYKNCLLPWGETCEPKDCTG